MKSLCGESEDLMARVEMYQNSALSPYLFSLVMDGTIRIDRLRYIDCQVGRNVCFDA